MSETGYRQVGWRKWKFVMNRDLRECTDICYADIAGKLGINNNGGNGGVLHQRARLPSHLWSVLQGVSFNIRDSPLSPK